MAWGRMKVACWAAAQTMLASGLLVGVAVAQKPDAKERLKQLGVATSLDREGLQPWHVKISFQLYDIGGKPMEKGTVEEWWINPSQHRIEIDSPSYHHVTPAPKDGSEDDSAGDRRSAYLITRLLAQVVNPVANFERYENVQVSEETNKFGKVALNCLSVSLNKSVGPVFCLTPGTDVLRMETDAADFSTVRNQVGKFQGVNVAIENGLSYGGVMAIVGHVDVLSTFNPGQKPVDVTANRPMQRSMPGWVSAGRILRKETPSFPEIARQKRIGGYVLLRGEIAEDGTIRSLVPIASPDPSLTQSAMAAVKHWLYTPYLINGKPVSVDTVITVNYGFRDVQYNRGLGQ